MSGSEAAAIRQLILDCAAGHKLSVDAMYVDELETAPAGLTQLIAALLPADERVLIIPSLLHLAGLGDPCKARADFESHGIRVLIAQHRRASAEFPGSGADTSDPLT